MWLASAVLNASARVQMANLSQRHFLLVGVCRHRQIHRSKED